MLLIHASALTTLAVKFPFSFEKPHFGSVQERSLLPLWIGRTLEKQLPQSHFFRKIRKANHVKPLIFENFSDSCLFKAGSLREHVDFWSNSIPASDFIINNIVEG